MPRFRRLLALVSAPADRARTRRLTPPREALAHAALGLASLTACLALAATDASAQAGGAAETPLHLAANRFEFTAADDAPPAAKPLRVHNGGTARFTDVRLTRLAYADSSRGVAWLVAMPRQTTVAPDELAVVGTLCVDPTGLAAGTYRATAAVAAREVPEAVPFTITLVVTDAGARAPHAAVRCGAATTR